MKMRKTVSAVLGIVGILLLAATVGLSLTSLNAPVRLLGRTPKAEARTEQWAEALEQGDYAALGSAMYGNPTLTPDRESEYAAGAVIRDVYMKSLRCEFTTECYSSEAGVSRDAVITAMDISAVMAQVKQELDPLIASRAEDWVADRVYDDDGDYREDFVMEALQDIVETVLRRQEFTAQRNVTLELVYEDGSWWILPQQELIDILAGKLGKGA